MGHGAFVMHAIPIGNDCVCISLPSLLVCTSRLASLHSLRDSGGDMLALLFSVGWSLVLHFLSEMSSRRAGTENARNAAYTLPDC